MPGGPDSERSHSRRDPSVTPVRVLVAEDSPTVRELLVAVLSGDPAVTVIGTATNGRQAVEMTRRLLPDVVTMDIRMPVMDGYDATRCIMTECPTPIVIVSGHVDVREVEVSFRALQAGALTLMPKPGDPTAPEFERSTRHFLRTVKAMARVNVVRRLQPRVVSLSEAPPTEQPLLAEPRVVAIAASTGGPGALQQIFSELPANFPAPILVVQHIAPGFIQGLANVLASATRLRVAVARAGQVARAGCVYLAPDEHHLRLEADGTLGLYAEPPVAGFRPSATLLFRSVAQVCGPRALAVVLTGMGRDGVDGLAAIRRAGGRIVAQDEASSIVYGMPLAAVEAGLADRVLSLNQLGAFLQHVRPVEDA